ncbi:alpha/beta fold hydrolase [Cyanobacteria bacterium FACHB-DQ100]|uniref:alpha/beta hydrolase n=1 Tax=Leptolyngbya sp. DQ-M1 TaxID=2933920 RepID=UPI0019B16760|nr:alpha/beta fold hydrolase [Cyanobacteria bacterium FACHB-DQ100]
MPNFFTQIGYSVSANSLPLQTRLQENRLPVRNEGCRSQFLLHSAPTPKVCLFFHGFTAAPYQFLPMGRAFYQAGYNVIIPRLPGHGRAGDWNGKNPPPLPEDAEVYKQFALSWLRHAQSFGNEVVVGGLSGGGTLAAWLALEKASQIDRALLFAAYLSSSNKVIDLFVKVLNTYFEWQTDEPGEPIGYKGFTFPDLRVFLDIGSEVLKRSRTAASPPMFVISTETDRAVSNPDHETLVENLLPRQPKTWYYCFDRALNIPHTMMTKAEGNRWESLLNVIAKAFVQSDLTWAEIEEIAYRMTEGKTCNQAVAELGLTRKASPDLPALITMLDKREIMIKRNPSWDSEIS